MARIRALAPGLVASEARVAEAVLADPSGVVHKTASQLGREAGTSATTVIRFARSVGFPGFQALGLALAVAAPRLRASGPSLAPSDGTAALVSHVATQGAAIVAETPDALDRAALDGTVAALGSARHVVIVGHGMTMPIALDAAYRMAHLGLPVEAPQDGHVQRARARALGPRDVCWAILHGGTLPSVVACARDARAAGATTVALTSYDQTPLTTQADLRLIAGSDGALSGVRSWASRLAHLAVIDMVVMALLQADSPERGGTGRYARSLDEFADLVEGEA